MPVRPRRRAVGVVELFNVWSDDDVAWPVLLRAVARRVRARRRAEGPQRAGLRRWSMGRVNSAIAVARSPTHAWQSRQRGAQRCCDVLFGRSGDRNVIVRLSDWQADSRASRL